MKEGENDMNWCLPQSCYITPHECLITRTVMPLGIFKYLQMYMFGGLFNVISMSVFVVSILKANKEAKRLSLYCGAPHQQNTDENKNAITTEAGQLLKSGRSFSQGLLMFKLRRKKIQKNRGPRLYVGSWKRNWKNGKAKIRSKWRWDNDNERRIEKLFKAVHSNKTERLSMATGNAKG